MILIFYLYSVISINCLVIHASCFKLNLVLCVVTDADSDTCRNMS